MLHVVSDPVGVGDDRWRLPLPERKAVEQEIEAQAWKELREMLSTRKHAGCAPSSRFEWGVPAIEILRYAKTHAIDMIAMANARTLRRSARPDRQRAENVVARRRVRCFTVHHSGAGIVSRD